jgi:hypothetical protein
MGKASLALVTCSVEGLSGVPLIGSIAGSYAAQYEMRTSGNTQRD